MGDNKNEQRDRQPNKRERAKASRGRRKSTGQALEWHEFAWNDFAYLAVALAHQGGAIRLGITRDGGAWALGIYLGDDYATEYIKPSEDTADAIAEIAEAWLGEGWKHDIAEAKKALTPPTTG